MSWLVILRKILELLRLFQAKLQPGYREDPYAKKRPLPPPMTQDEMIRHQRELYRKNHPGARD